MTIKVVHNIRRSTYVEDPGWVVYWEELPHCTYMTTPQYFECSTREYDLSICFPDSAYITKNAIDSLTAEEIGSISSRIIDVVNVPYAYQTGPHFDKIAFNYYCWRFDVNSVFDPCDGVTCDNICKEYDLWSQTCVDGSCIDGALVEQNSPSCEYIPPDPCEGVVCDPSCTSYELWTQKCVDGACVNDTMIEQDSSYCGYVPPDEEYWYDPIADNWGYILILIAAGVAIDHVLE